MKILNFIIVVLLLTVIYRLYLIMSWLTPKDIRHRVKRWLLKELKAVETKLASIIELDEKGKSREPARFAQDI